MMSRFRRKNGSKKIRKNIFIFTEGVATEPNYFNAIRDQLRSVNIRVSVVGTGYHTQSLVDKATELLQARELELGDEVWVVFDKDDFTDFDNAIKSAAARGFNVAYSNECFELWFLLHFVFQNTSSNRPDMITRITGYLQKYTGNPKMQYTKNDKDLFNLLAPLQSTAVKNATKLLATYVSGETPSQMRPVTKVHELLIKLKKFS